MLRHKCRATSRVTSFHSAGLPAPSQKNLRERAGQSAEGAGQHAKLPVAAEDQIGEQGNAEYAADERVHAASLFDIKRSGDAGNEGGDQRGQHLE